MSAPREWEPYFGQEFEPFLQLVSGQSRDGSTSLNSLPRAVRDRSAPEGSGGPVARLCPCQ